MSRKWEHSSYDNDGNPTDKYGRYEHESKEDFEDRTINSSNFPTEPEDAWSTGRDPSTYDWGLGDD